MNFDRRYLASLGYADLDLAKKWVKLAKSYPDIYWIQAMAKPKDTVEEEQAADLEKLLASGEPGRSTKSAEPIVTASEHKAAIGRRKVYHSLSQAFTYGSRLDQDFANELRSGLESLGLTNNHRITLLLDHFSEALGSKETNLTVEEEQSAIFFDIVEPVAQPYETIYRGEHQTVGSQTSQLQEKYKEAGFEVVVDPEPIDHIANVLAFRSHLSQKEIEARSQKNKEDSAVWAEAGKEFLRSHLSWITYCCDDIMAICKRKKLSNLYRSLVQITREVIQADLRASVFR